MKPSSEPVSSVPYLFWTLLIMDITKQLLNSSLFKLSFNKIQTDILWMVQFTCIIGNPERQYCSLNIMKFPQVFTAM